MKNRTRKCIAVMMSRPERQYQSDVLKGIYKTAFAHDINVAVFSTSLFLSIKGPEDNDFNVFKIINFEKLSGIIYFPDTFADMEIVGDLDKFVRRASENGVPVVTVDRVVEGFPCFNSDDYEGIKTITEHMMFTHHCDKIAFMTGIKGHPHAERRLECFRKIMEEHQASIPEDWIYYGDFWITQGESFIDQLLQAESGFPQAIICANEYMAISVYKALLKKGISMPSEVKLGYFDADSTRLKFMTSVVRISDEVGSAACEALIRMSEGETVCADQYLVSCKCEENYALTCGCQEFENYDFSQAEDIFNEGLDTYFTEYNDITEVLHKCEHMEDIFWSLEDFQYFLKEYKGMYFCMYDGWDRPDYTQEKTHDKDTMQLYYYRKVLPDNSIDQHVGRNIVFPKSMMLPDLFSTEKEPSAYFFREIHFFDKDYGYVVIDIGQTMEAYDYIINYFLKDIVSAIESQCKMQSVNYMYSTDIMTGMSNRNSFNAEMGKYLEQARTQSMDMIVALGDMNGLKYINDTFGHNEGDVAIKNAAKLLLESHVRGSIKEKNFRIGGDEFVKIAIGRFPEDSIEDFKQAFWTSTVSHNEKSGKDYPIYVSLGVCCTDGKDAKTVDDLLFEADAAMYEEKLRLKKETGFNPKRTN